jgi:putative oxidoreductase
MDSQVNKTTTDLEPPGGVWALSILRVIAGIIMAAHGWQKLTGFEQWKAAVVDMGIPFPAVSAPLAVAGELAGGLGLLVGLLTPIAAFGVLSTMAVAIVTVHLPHGLFAKNNGYEYPLLMLCVAMFFMLRGAGPISLDAFRRRGSENPTQRAATWHSLPSTTRQDESGSGGRPHHSPA